MKSNNGGPAFPTAQSATFVECRFDEGRKTESVVAFSGEGMTLRDYFAAKAIQGMLASPQSKKESFIALVEASWALADAMLLSRGAR